VGNLARYKDNKQAINVKVKGNKGESGQVNLQIEWTKVTESSSNKKKKLFMFLTKEIHMKVKKMKMD
jgi:hypothetical protein